MGERSLGRADQVKSIFLQQQAEKILQQNSHSNNVNNNNEGTDAKEECETANGASSQGQGHALTASVFDTSLPVHASVLQFNHSTTVSDIVQVSKLLKG